MFWSTRKTADLSFRFENAYVHPTAEVADDVVIGPFSYIGPECRIGEGCHLHNNVTLAGHTLLGQNNEVFPGAVLGGEPQDKKYRGEESWVIIGDGNVIRENVTIHGGTRQSGGVTRVGSRNLIMAGCHVAHDCILEDDIIMANNVLLGGHVQVERCANLGGQAAVHHFVTIGRFAFVGGMARIAQDVPPFMLVEGNPARVWAVNKIGLQRREFSDAEIQDLKEVHKALFRSQMPRSEALVRVEEQWKDSEHVSYLVEFLRRMEAGNQGRARQPYSVTL
ncbi:MAG: acyl-ACP--UDP-N-acetylglucosamine O-acyltransferase [Planctomycetes bacterium]|nr:acyl-ACP--UDP-N-acetylglucosamine O-acyltransferase [Planctomycetota bacterium]